MAAYRARRNPALADVVTPLGVDRLEWYKAFSSGYAYGRDLVLGEARERLENYFPLASLPTREELAGPQGAAEAAGEAIAHASFPVTDFWKSRNPEKVASAIVDTAFAGVAADKASQRALTEAKKSLVRRIRSDAKDVGLMLAAPEPFPTPPKPPKPPKAPRPVATPKPASVKAASVKAASVKAASVKAASVKAASFRVAEEAFVFPDEPPPASQRARKRRKPQPVPREVAERYTEQRAATEGRTPTEKLADATLRAERLEFYRGEDGRLRDRPCSMDQRLDGFWDSRLGYRPPYTVPPSVLAQYREHIIIAMLPSELVAQVWTKGQLTEVFSAPRVGKAFDTAFRYVDRWRGMGENGEIRSDAKRSRLKSAVYLTNYLSQTEIGPIEEIAPPLYDDLMQAMADAEDARLLANPRQPAVTVLRVRNPYRR